MAGFAATADRVFYRAQQRGLALSLSLGSQLWHRLLNPSAQRPSRKELSELGRRYDKLLETDLANAERGVYPVSLIRPFPVLEYLRSAPEFVLEMPRVLLRKLRGGYDELPEQPRDGRFPNYYLRTFHWQSDGWLSDRSARLYDPSVEFLFLGTADVMRRMALPAVVDACAGVGRPRILDVACGTGRFLQQLHHVAPGARLYGLDLSPHYLRHAAKRLAGIDGVGLLCENAESIPLADESCDVITSVFLFHELPRKVRRTVMREAARLLAPGGRFVVCDSAQLSDSAKLKTVLAGFHAAYHEPFYKNYLEDPLEDALQESGFDIVSVQPHFVSKVVVAEKRVVT